MRNRDLPRLIRKLNAINGVCAMKIAAGSPYAAAGHPDILVVRDGIPLFLEIKHGSDRLSPLQLKRAQDWQAAGAIVLVCRTEQEVLDAVQGLTGATSASDVGSGKGYPAREACCLSTGSPDRSGGSYRRETAG